MLNDHWSEQNEHGDVIECLYFAPFIETEGQAVKFQAVVDELSVDDSVDESTGTHREEERRERTEVEFRSPLLAPLQEGLVAVPKYAGERFSIEEIIRDDQFTTLRLYRYATRSLERRGVQRGR